MSTLFFEAIYSFWLSGLSFRKPSKFDDLRPKIYKDLFNAFHERFQNKLQLQLKLIICLESYKFNYNLNTR